MNDKSIATSYEDRTGLVEIYTDGSAYYTDNHSVLGSSCANSVSELMRTDNSARLIRKAVEQWARDHVSDWSTAEIVKIRGGVVALIREGKDEVEVWFCDDQGPIEFVDVWYAVQYFETLPEYKRSKRWNIDAAEALRELEEEIEYRETDEYRWANAHDAHCDARTDEVRGK